MQAHLPPSPQEFFLEAALYTPFSLREYNPFEDALQESDTLEGEPLEDGWKSGIRIEFYTGSLDAYCIECNKESVFKSTVNLPLTHTATKPDTTDALIESGRAYFGAVATDIAIHGRIPRTKQITFICTRNSAHVLEFVLRFTGSEMMKIGQYPSLADLKEYGVRKYRALLGKDKYTELTKAIGLHAHSVGIGSFVYLRRIFEHLIAQAHGRAAKESSWDDDAYTRTDRMEDRIALLQHELPAPLVANRKVYGILSAGIHTLGEDDCLRHFAPVRNAIELILDAELQARERRRKEDDITKSINALHSTIKKHAGNQ